MMLGSKGILTPLIPDCSVLRTLTILKNIRNSLIFLRKMATYSCFWQVPRSEIFLQANLRQISDLLTLVSCYKQHTKCAPEDHIRILRGIFFFHSNVCFISLLPYEER